MIEKASTSLHRLNADLGLPTYKKILWVFFNLFENFLSPFMVRKVPVSHLVVPEACLESHRSIGAEENMSSPTRLFCDLFWQSLDFEDISKFLGGSINSIEIGCGHGIYGEYLQTRCSQGYRYLGLDPTSSQHWSNLRKKNVIEFAVGSSDSVLDHLPNKNFLFTQSAIEHFENDLDFFKRVAAYIHRVDHPTFQIHTFPSPYTLFTYPLHGIRQYNMRNIKQIIALFPNSDIKLIGLGSAASFFHHLSNITVRRQLGLSDLRATDNAKYCESLRKAALTDLTKPVSQVASFYALIIKTSGSAR